MTEDEELRKVFEKYEKLLFKAANSVQSETPYSFVAEFSKKVDEAGLVFKQLARRYIDRAIPDVDMSETAQTVLRRVGAFNETPNVKLTTYVQMVSKLTASAEQFKDRIQAHIDEDEKNGEVTTVTDLKEYIKTELQTGQGITVKYSNGAKMPVDKYAEMLARTTRIETQNIAMLGKALDDGNDLVECSTISPTCPTCASLQGRIYSISGKTAGYPSLYDTAFKNGYSIIHPNCRHQFFPYNPKFHTEAERQALEQNTRLPFGIDPQSEQAREAYARSQMQMRRWNKELNEFSKMRELYGADAPYKTLGAFRRAYRSEEGSLPYAKTHYYRRDEKQYEEFKEVLGEENVSEIFDKFQEMKYNKKAEFAKKLLTYKDEKIRRKLGSPEYPLTLHADRQGKHIKGHKNFIAGKSYLAVDSIEDGLRLSREIVYKYHGTGEIQRDRSGNWNHKEKVLTDVIVGYSQTYEGTWVATKAVTIHYSKNGTHIVPTIIEEEK